IARTSDDIADLPPSSSTAVFPDSARVRPGRRRSISLPALEILVLWHPGFESKAEDFVRCSPPRPTRSCGGFLFIPLRWLLLPAYPGVEVFWGIHVYAQEHLRVLCPAELCALTEK